jgi:predicted Rossmann fold flavoprotein
MVELAADVVIVGAGAAGLATAVMTRRQNPSLDVLLVDSSPKPGTKILISGGGRCNVTNTVVTEADFWGGRRPVIRKILQAFPAAKTVAFFEDLGVPLHEEAGGKLFPNSNRARDVLDALLSASQTSGVRLASGCRVSAIARDADGRGFLLHSSTGPMTARFVVLATGGRSLPKTGSDGTGYALAASVGHSLIEPTPALAPLVLEAETPFSVHSQLSGVSVDAEISVWIDGAVATRQRGPVLWTHFGLSGPAVLNVSRHWARARLEGRDVRLTLNFHPGSSYENEEADWRRAAAERPRSTVRSMLAARLPDAVGLAIAGALDIAGGHLLADLTRDDRKRLVHALTAWPLPVLDTRGYDFAEVTAGGVRLNEIDPASMESRVCPGLFLVGEILDVDGRIGGFNFQWAWSSAWVASRALAARGRVPA